MNKGGRKFHNYWQIGMFEKVSVQGSSESALTERKERTAALCKICGSILKNTTISRLQSHRNVCRIINSKSSDIPCTTSVTTASADNEKNTTLLSASCSDTESPEITNSQYSVIEIGNVYTPSLHRKDHIISSAYSNSTEIEISQGVFEDAVIINNTKDDLYSTQELFELLNPKKHQHECKAPSNSTGFSASSSAAITRSSTPTTVSSLTSSSTTSLYGNLPISSSPFSNTPNMENDLDDLVTVSSEDGLNRTDKNKNHFRSPSVARKKVKCVENETSVKKFFDSVSTSEKDDIDMLLADLFFGCNIPFSVIESDHFKTLINKLRPAYKIPCRKTLASTLLNKAFEKAVHRDSLMIDEESVLLIDGWKNTSSNSKNVVCMLHTSTGHKAFLEAYDFTCISETGKSFLKLSIKVSSWLNLNIKLNRTPLYLITLRTCARWGDCPIYGIQAAIAVISFANKLPV